jgi:hypothetical protein
MDLRNSLLRLTGAGLIAATTVLGPATAAQAAPTGCSAWTLGTDAFASCTGGTGTVRAHVWCSSVWGDETARLGGAVPPGQTSVAKCPPTWQVQDWWYTTYG